MGTFAFLLVLTVLSVLSGSTHGFSPILKGQFNQNLMPCTSFHRPGFLRKGGETSWFWNCSTGPLRQMMASDSTSSEPPERQSAPQPSSTSVASEQDKGKERQLAESFRQVVMRRRSARSFKPDPIPDDILGQILLLTQRAPSSFNSQPYNVIIVRDEQTKRQISDCMMGESNKRKVLEAPVTAVFAADLTNLKKLPQVQDVLAKQGFPPAFLKMVRPGLTVFSGGHRALFRFPSFVARKLAFGLFSLFAVLPKVSSAETWATKNAMLAVENYLLAAAAYDLDTCPMEGFDMRRLRRRLKIPRSHTVPLIISTGYGADQMVGEDSKDAQQSFRFAPEEVFFENRFGSKLHSESISTYSDNFLCLRPKGKEN